MLIYIGYIFIILIIIYFGIAIYEVKNAPLIDSEHQTINEEKSSEHFKNNFCNNCLKRIDGFCNNGVKFVKINDEIIELCKKRNFFEPK